MDIIIARPLITKLKIFQVRVKFSHHCITLEDCPGENPFQKNRIDTLIVKHPAATQGLKRSPAQYRVNESSQGENIKPTVQVKDKNQTRTLLPNYGST
ncbi:hypothetical protein TSUD_75900 [Trifolium subterraneum]|nr:hypothetical protein TSUD_75900 [Trifolium subterraneum]